MAPPSKEATIGRPSAGANANRFGLHCVGIGDFLCCAIRLRRRRTSLNQSPDAPDSCERCGLGLTNANVDKLKATDPMQEPLMTGIRPIISAPDPFFHFPSFVLLVFGLYAIRFFFNNYLYLHHSYDEHRLEGLDQKQLSSLVSSSYRDLFLSIF